MTGGRRPRLATVSLAGAPAIALAIALTVGCETLKEMTSSAPSPTNGVSLSLAIRKPSQQSYELYRVTRHGKIEYGGGLRAFNGSTNWSADLSKAEIDEFLGLLGSVGWCDTEPHSVDEDAITTCEIELVCPNGRHTWTVKGEPEGVTRMRAFLDPIARRRLDAQLDRLPDASEAPAPSRAPAPAPHAPEETSPVPPSPNP